MKSLWLSLLLPSCSIRTNIVFLELVFSLESILMEVLVRREHLQEDFDEFMNRDR